MSSALIERHTSERAKLVNLVENYASSAAEEGRDLSESELETIKRTRSRIGELDAQLEVLAEDLTLAEDTAARLRAIDPKVVAGPTMYRSAGEVLYDMLHLSEEESRTRFSQARRRAAEHMGTDSTKTVPTAGDLGGLKVDAVQGAIIDPYPRGMPLANAVGLIPAPNSLHFMRPKIEDPNFATGVGPQGSGAQAGFEKAELPSKAFDVSADPVALATVGGYLNISQQLISLMPGSLDLIVGHMNRRLANRIDAAVAAAVTGTGATAIATPTDAAELHAAIARAVAQYYTATNAFPTWIAFGAAGYQLLAGFTDAAGRPLFPYLGASNADGTNSFASGLNTVGGLTPVLTPGITDAKLYVGGPDGVEGFLYRFPLLEAVEPSVLGRQIAVAAAVGTHNPIADSIQVIGT